MTLFIGVEQAQADTTLLSDDFTGPLTWTTSNDSISVQNGNLVLGPTAANNGAWAAKAASITLSPDSYVVIESRQKLQSGGLDYCLPREDVSFEDGTVLHSTYLPNEFDGYPLHGWAFGWLTDGVGPGSGNMWTQNDNHPVPHSGYWTTAAADYWAVTKMILTPSGGELFVKPDDPDKGWSDDTFYPVASQYWSHSGIDQIKFVSPWSSVCDVDYVNITSVPRSYTIDDPFSFTGGATTPEPSTIVLLGMAAVSMMAYAWRKRRRTA